MSSYESTKESTTQKISRLTAMNKGPLRDKLQMLNKMLSEDNDMIMKFIGEGDTFKDVPMGDEPQNAARTERTTESKCEVTPKGDAPTGYTNLPDDDS